MQDLAYVNFWKRIGAFLIDVIMLYTLTPMFMAFLCVFLKISPPTPSVANLSGMVILGALFLAISWLYFAATESSRKQATLGKRVLGIMVTDLQGNRISFLKASLRFWGKFAIFPGFSLTKLLFKKRALHDVIAKTIVVNESRLYSDDRIEKGKAVSI